MSKTTEIETILRNSFNPQLLEVINESYKHAGHSGDNGSGESHFKVVISSASIPGNTRVEKHRNIHSTLNGIEFHALQIDLK